MLLRRGFFALTLCLTGCPAEKLQGPGSIPQTGTQARAGLDAAAKGLGFRFEPLPSKPKLGKSEAPLSLTASDGTGLKLVGMSAKGVIEGPLAFTELTLKFRNPESRTREGRFRITLPENASVSRFAMKIHGRWQEGEVVERQKARRTYEDFLHRKQDPALLEQAAGNEFTARVFPIPANAVKELVISFSHELAQSSEPYRIPLRGLPQIDKLDIQVLVAKQDAGAAASSLGGTTLRHETVTVDKTNWVPDLDFEIKVPEQTGFGLRHENLVVARVKPPVSNAPEGVNGLTLLVDTSASRALGYAAQLRLLDRLVEGLSRGAGADTPLRVVAFDQETVSLFEGKASGYGKEARTALNDRRALGASDITQALEWLAENTTKGRYDRLILVSDGVATSGEVKGEAVASAALSLAAVGFERIDALALGGLRDSDQLKRITTAGLAHDGVVIDGALPITEIGHKLSHSTTSGLKVQVPGAKWVWPQQLDGVQPGDEVLIFTDLPAGKPFSLMLSGKPVELSSKSLTQAPRPLLQRAWVRARINRLMHQAETLGAGDPDLQTALRTQVIGLSTEHRVLSPYTALLVLETERDYRRYGIKRTALANILTVGASGVTVLADRTVTRPKPRPMKKAKTVRRRPRPTDLAVEGNSAGPAGALNSLDDSAGDSFGNIGTKGTGRGGGGQGRGLGAGSAGIDGASSSSGEGSPSRARRPRSRRARAPRPSAAPRAEMEPPMERSASRRPATTTESLAAMDEEAPSAIVPEPIRERDSRRRPPPPPRPRPEAKKKQNIRPLIGPMAEVMALLDKDDVQGALAKAEAWREENPGDVLALVALGEALEKQGDLPQAARAYGSIVDLFATRADLLRFAASRLERLEHKAAIELAQDTYAKAVAQRKDHPSSHRGLAFALVKLGKYEAAFEALVFGMAQRYPSRFPGVKRILTEDLGLVAAAWNKAQPARSAEIQERLKKAGGHMATKESLRFVLTWETDANDVDFHIRDGQGGHAYYSSRTLGSGGTLYADITTGYGPECFTIPGKASAFPYKLQAHYYRKGPMGYGMGRVQILHHDGQGGLRFDERPFVVMQDGAYLDLGEVNAKWLR